MGFTSVGDWELIGCHARVVMVENVGFHGGSDTTWSELEPKVARNVRRLWKTWLAKITLAFQRPLQLETQTMPSSLDMQEHESTKSRMETPEAMQDLGVLSHSMPTFLATILGFLWREDGG